MSNTNNEASWTIRAAAVLTLILPAGSAGNCMANEGAVTLVSIPNGGLENNGHGWSVEFGNGRFNRLQWLTEGAREGKTCAKLSYSGKEWLWLNTPPLAKWGTGQWKSRPWSASLGSGGQDW